MYIIKIHENYTVDMLHSSFDILQLYAFILVYICSLFH